MATITQRNGRWRAQVRILGHAISQTFDQKRDAVAWSREVEVALRNGNYMTASDITVAEACARYTAERETRKPLGRSAMSDVRRIARHLGEIPLQSLRARDIVDYAASRRVAPATLSMELAQLRQIYRNARVLWDIDHEDPVAHAHALLRHEGLVGRPLCRDRRVSPVELDRLTTYLSANRRMPMADIVLFAANSAMRLGEIVRILWRDVDPVLRTVIIRDRKDPRRKTGNDGHVPLVGEAWPILDRQPRTDQRVFPHHSDSIGRAFRAACAALGIRDLRIHDLRHEATSRLFEQGLTIPEVAVVTGHRDWASLRRYTHLQAAHVHDALAQRRRIARNA